MQCECRFNSVCFEGLLMCCTATSDVRFIAVYRFYLKSYLVQFTGLFIHSFGQGMHMQVICFNVLSLFQNIVMKMDERKRQALIEWVRCDHIPFSFN